MPLLPSTTKPDLAFRDTFRARRERRLAAWVGWRYSLLFVTALLAIGVVRMTGIGPDGGSTRLLSFRVTDGATGAPLPGASVSVGGVASTADGAGIARFETGWQTQAVVVAVPGYAESVTEITGASPVDQSIPLAPIGRSAVATPQSAVAMSTAAAVSDEATKAP